MLLQPGHGPLPFVHVATLGYVALVYLGVAATGVCLLRGTTHSAEAPVWSAPALAH